MGVEGAGASVQPRSSFTSGKYEPSESVYELILWSLIALSIVEERGSPKKIVWIEIFHEQVRGKKTERSVIIDMATRFKLSGPHRMTEILRDNRDRMDVKDREFLIKSCCLLASSEGVMSRSERDLILGFVEVLGISSDRLW